MITIAIVEDEEIFVEELKLYIQKYGDTTGTQFNIRCFSDGYDIVENYPEGISIILMDIEMNLMNGMEAAEEIRKKDHQVVILFITNAPQYAIQGYRVNAVDYVLKPVSYYAFSESLRRAIKLLPGEDSYLTLKMRDGIVKIRNKDIFWVESQGHRLTFHLEDMVYETTTISMKDLEKQLEGSGFSRCNTGYLVNLDKVMGIKNGYVRVGEELLPISRGRKNQFIDALTHHLMG